MKLDRLDDILERLSELESKVEEKKNQPTENLGAMNEKEIIRAILAEQKLSQAALAKRIPGWKQSNVSNVLNLGHKGMRIDVLYKVLAALGYEIVIRNEEKEWVYSPEEGEDEEL